MVIGLGEFDLGLSEGVQKEIDIEKVKTVQKLVVVFKIKHDVLGSRNLHVGQENKQILHTVLFKTSNFCSFQSRMGEY